MLTYLQAIVIGAAARSHRTVPGLQPRPLGAPAGADRRQLEHLVTDGQRHREIARTWRSSSLCTSPPRSRCWSSSGRLGPDHPRLPATLRPSPARGGSSPSTDERLAWLLIVATIPVGITGLLFEHTFRTLFAKPVAAAIFLMINGLILLAGERLRRAAPATTTQTPRLPASGPAARAPPSPSRPQPGHPALPRSWRDRLLPDLRAAGGNQPVRRRDGRRPGPRPGPRDAARFSFLLATPVILAAGRAEAALPRRVRPARTSTAKSSPARSSPESPPTCRCAA